MSEAESDATNQVTGLYSVLCCYQSTMMNDVDYALRSTLTWEMIASWFDPEFSDRNLKSYNLLLE